MRCSSHRWTSNRFDEITYNVGFRPIALFGLFGHPFVLFLVERDGNARHDAVFTDAHQKDSSDTSLYQW
jgi:hypothetical protein